MFFCEIWVFSEHVFTVSKNSFSFRFNSCCQRSPAQKPVRLSAINTKFSWKIVFTATKIQKQSPYLFWKRSSVTLLLKRGSSTATFLRTINLKHICERLLVNITISVTNSEGSAQRSSVKNVLLEIFQDSHCKASVPESLI